MVVLKVSWCGIIKVLRLLDTANDGAFRPRRPGAVKRH